MQSPARTGLENFSLSHRSSGLSLDDSFPDPLSDPRSSFLARNDLASLEMFRPLAPNVFRQ